QQPAPLVNLSMGDITRIVSWNVRGLNHPVKRGKILAHLKSLKADIIFLQETHIRNTAKNKLRVAIIIKKNVLFDHGCTIGDPDGRFLMVSGTINCVPVTLINVYGPNFDDPAFFQKVLLISTLLCTLIKRVLFPTDTFTPTYDVYSIYYTLTTIQRQF
uniref:exodeoxyribonuclease III n=1 Tax=Sander lucioperca TaxID=283035 RepID=A0A8D0AHU0_SANLU